MAIHQSTVKRNRQSKKRKLYNREYKKQVKVAVRVFEVGVGRNCADAV